MDFNDKDGFGPSTVGALRAAIAGLPDDMPFSVYNGCVECEVAFGLAVDPFDDGEPVLMLTTE